MPFSSRIWTVLADVFHAGAVHPRGCFPVRSVRILMLLARTARSCSSDSSETNS